MRRPRWPPILPKRNPMPSRHNQKGRSKGGPPFVSLRCFMLDCAAWRHLTPAARAVYVEVARLYNGRNNGFLALSVRNAAERCNINKDTAGRALEALRAHGFIDCVTPGGFSRKNRHASEWRLTVETCDRMGIAASKAFMRWSPGPDLERKTRSPLDAPPVPRFRTVGFGKAA